MDNLHYEKIIRFANFRNSNVLIGELSKKFPYLIVSSADPGMHAGGERHDGGPDDLLHSPDEIEFVDEGPPL